MGRKRPAATAATPHMPPRFAQTVGSDRMPPLQQQVIHMPGRMTIASGEVYMKVLARMGKDAVLPV
jgi:hypothetical protein